MTSLHASYIIDSEKKEDLVEQQNLTKSIFSIVLEFCSPEDICQFSACSRLFHKISNLIHMLNEFFKKIIKN